MTSMRATLLLVTLVLTACDGQDAADRGAGVTQPSPTEATPAEAATPGPECVETNELIAIDNEWEPSCVVVPGGELKVRNEGKALHSFTIVGPVDVDLKPGKSETVDVSEATESEGETFFNCKYHPGMSGFLWVA